MFAIGDRLIIIDKMFDATGGMTCLSPKIPFMVEFVTHKKKKIIYKNLR